MNDIVSDIDKKDSFKTAQSTNYELRSIYRLYRKKLLNIIRKLKKKQFTKILYITPNYLPKEYILSFQKQYPDKIIEVLMPIFKKELSDKKEFLRFEYQLQNKDYSAKIYKLPIFNDNIQVYRIYSDAFSELENYSDLFQIKYLAHYTKCLRLTVNKLKPDIIHAENIPFLFGQDFEYNKTFNHPAKLVQVIHDFSIYSSDEEPFWIALNLLDKKGLKNFCKDKLIKKNIAALFGIKIKYNFAKLNDCLNYLYQNFEQYRKIYGPEIKNNENILIERLNKRTLKLFPNSIPESENNFNSMYYSAKKAKSIILNSIHNTQPNWINKFSDKISYLRTTNTQNKDRKIAYPFDVKNFREDRINNKIYIFKELSQKRIETKFTDLNLFENNDNFSIQGYLDMFFSCALLFVPFVENSTEEEIKTSALSILKCFELKKNIRVIFNIPKNYTTPYLKSFFEFLKSQRTLDGKWVLIEGQINLNQFMAGSDMILLTNGELLGIENILYCALRFGCIPISTEHGSCGEIITNIFDDMTIGCGFKASEHDIDNTTNQNNDLSEKLNNNIVSYTNTLIKALSFYTLNSSSWNLIIKNAMNYKSGPDFETIEKYNNIYEDIII